MSDDDQGGGGMSPAAARKLEYMIIGLGVLALLMIFQPFNISLFAIGCILVVLAGLINNLLPLAQPGVPARSVVRVAMVVAMIFCIVLLVAIFVAHLYGVFFLKPPESQYSDGQESSSTQRPGTCTTSHGPSLRSPLFWLASSRCRAAARTDLPLDQPPSGA